MKFMLVIICFLSNFEKEHAQPLRNFTNISGGLSTRHTVGFFKVVQRSEFKQGYRLRMVASHVAHGPGVYSIIYRYSPRSRCILTSVKRPTMQILLKFLKHTMFWLNRTPDGSTTWICRTRKRLKAVALECTYKKTTNKQNTQYRCGLN